MHYFNLEFWTTLNGDDYWIEARGNKELKYQTLIICVEKPDSTMQTQNHVFSDTREKTSLKSEKS